MAVRNGGRRKTERVVPPARRESLIDRRLRAARGEDLDEEVFGEADDDDDDDGEEEDDRPVRGKRRRRPQPIVVHTGGSCLSQIVWGLLGFVVLFIAITVFTGYFGIDLKSMGTKAAVEAVTNLGPTPQIVVRDQQGNVITPGGTKAGESPAGGRAEEPAAAGPVRLTSGQIHEKITSVGITYKQLANVEGYKMPNGVFVIMADVDSANIPSSEKLIGTIVEDEFVHPDAPKYPCSQLGNVTYPKYVTDNNIPEGRIPIHPAEGPKKGQSFFCSAPSGAEKVMGKVVFLFPPDQ